MALSISNGDTFTLGAAQKNERNILARLKRSDCTFELYQELWRDKKMIEAITAHHLGRMDPSACVVQDTVTWIKGQFNTCIPVYVHESDGSTSKKIFRCPLAHKVGEQYTPGAVDEKVRAEVAASLLRTPGVLSLIVYSKFTHRKEGAGFTRDPSDSHFNHPHVLLEYIDRTKGIMLSETLREFRDTDPSRVQNLCRGISRIMLSLTKKQQSYIGSLRFNDDTSVTLANRPLLSANSISESEGAPKILDRTDKTCGHFIDDMLKFREEAFSAQPNAVNHEENCCLQMLHMTMLRLLKSQFIDCHSEGPFVLQLTDFHSSNIFIDGDWNSVALIDLEFVCALPPSMMNVPYWLIVDNIDDIAESMDAYSKMHKTFLDVLQSEEQNSSSEHEIRISSAIQEAWTSYSTWFYRSLTSINGMAFCVEDHLYEKFQFNISRNEEDQWMRLMSSFWPSDSTELVARKLREKAKYNEDIARHFEEKLNAEGKVSYMSPIAASAADVNPN